MELSSSPPYTSSGTLEPAVGGSTLQVHRLSQRHRTGVDTGYFRKKTVALTGAPLVLSWTTELEPSFVRSLQQYNSRQSGWEGVELGDIPYDGLSKARSVRADLIRHAKAGFDSQGIAINLRDFSKEIDVLVGAAPYHVDTGWGSPGVYFVICFASRGGYFSMPNLGLKLKVHPGLCIAFDPLEPHGVCSGNGGKPPKILCLTINLNLGLPACLALNKVQRIGDPYLFCSQHAKLNDKDGSFDLIYEKALSRESFPGPLWVPSDLR